jgi:DNA polymerase-3 subunit epsilon
MNDLFKGGPLLFVDVETTGLPPKGTPEVHPNQPRIVQCAAILTTSEGEELNSFNSIILPSGFEIPDGAAKIHGITTKKAQEYGLPLFSAMLILSNLASRATTVIAHNLAFDIAVIRSEIMRIEKPDRFEPLNRFCTMRASTNVCGLVGAYGKPKPPKLIELYRFCYGEEAAKKFERTAHDAMADTRAAMQCYFQLRNFHSEKLKGSNNDDDTNKTKSKVRTSKDSAGV